MNNLRSASGAIAFLILCLLLGGASAAGALANALLQLVALVAILIVLWRSRGPWPAGTGVVVAIAGLFVLHGFLTLVPLPASLWASLPFREHVAEGYRMLGMALPAIPLSLAPRSTIISLLAFLPPAAMFLLTLRLDVNQRRLLPVALIGFAAVSILLGGFQYFGGPDSPLRPYQITNPDRPVGFFANVNHEVTLLLCALAFSGFLAARSAMRRSRSKRSGGLVVSIGFALFLTVGIAISGSSAGYALFPVAALAAALIYRRATAKRVGWPWLAGIGALLLVFGGLAIQGPLSNETLSAEIDEQSTSRGTLAKNTSAAIAESFPVGTGLGTFSTVYRRFEDPDRTIQQFANHAHNDYLEVTLEAGLAGILLVAAFLFWWLAASFKAWRNDFRGAEVARGGSVVIAIVALHSLVDYPIRTAAIGAVVAMACAMLLPPRTPPVVRREEAEAREQDTGLRHLEAV
jgi:O-antigen ligase